MTLAKAKTLAPGIALCALAAIPCWYLGTMFPIVGGPVFGILLGMAIALFWKDKKSLNDGIAFTSKKILQYAVILLGFDLNLFQIAQVGAMSLPVICSTIATSLIVAFLFYKIAKAPANTSTLIGVGSSICGGSAIAATAPVIKAKDEEIAQAIAVVFLFNVIAALVFPSLGGLLGMSNEGFALFAGTAINDTSSVTAAAAAWDGMHPGAAALDQAVIVKLTRTLAIIPITLVLALWGIRKAKRKAAEAAAAGEATHKTSQGPLGDFSLKRAFPMFILWFLVAALITTLWAAAGQDTSVFAPLKDLSKFFIIMAMFAIGLGTDLVKLMKTGGKPILLGACCWVSIAVVSLSVQAALGLW